jgi:hypothetical protein
MGSAPPAPRADDAPPDCSGIITRTLGVQGSGVRVQRLGFRGLGVGGGWGGGGVGGGGVGV